MIVCLVDNQPEIDGRLSLSVVHDAILGCSREEEIKAFWPETYPCSAFRVPCSDLDNGNYFTSGFTTRVCNSEGEWLPPDYSTCSVKATTRSFALIWMTFSTTSGTYVLSQLERIKSDVSASVTIT